MLIWLGFDGAPESRPRRRFPAFFSSSFDTPLHFPTACAQPEKSLDCVCVFAYNTCMERRWKATEKIDEVQHGYGSRYGSRNKEKGERRKTVKDN